MSLCVEAWAGELSIRSWKRAPAPGDWSPQHDALRWTLLRAAHGLYGCRCRRKVVSDHEVLPKIRSAWRSPYMTRTDAALRWAVSLGERSQQRMSGEQSLAAAGEIQIRMDDWSRAVSVLACDFSRAELGTCIVLLP